LPWFAGVTLGPTLGYLLGFVAAAIWVGRLKSDNTVSIFLRMLGGQGLIYLCGVTVLSFFVGAQNAFAAGVIPFVASDLLKVIAAALTVRLMKAKTKSRQNVA
jgi:biotin transport system substrate-specific component